MKYPKMPEISRPIISGISKIGLSTFGELSVQKKEMEKTKNIYKQLKLQLNMLKGV